jgi:hypothetical protein
MVPSTDMSNVRSFGTSHNPKPTTTSAKTTPLCTNRLLHLRVPASAARGPHRSGVPPIAGPVAPQLSLGGASCRH